jgi:glycosyltransferase involved in cell wall biosynthesis
MNVRRTPLVSVVVPAYNVARFVPDSVGSVLAQSMGDLECIVVDDGSTDDTVAVAKAFDDPRVRVICKVNAGTVSDARNVGIAEARGELVAFLDADDWWAPHKLARQVELLERRPDLGLVYCGYAIANEDMSIRTMVHPARQGRDLRRQILLEAIGIGFASTAMVPATVLAEVGGFNLELSVSEDIDLADRIAQRYPFESVDECLVVYRLHDAQGHRRLAHYEHDMLWILDDRFGDAGVRDPDSWRRGRANLYTRLAAYELAARDLGRSWSHLRQALGHGPSRVVLLPLEGMVRRTRRRLDVLRAKASLESAISHSRTTGKSY